MKDTSLAFAGSMALSGILLAVTNLPTNCNTIPSLFSTGAGIAIIGIVVFI
jgi:hypothetical protein